MSRENVEAAQRLIDAFERDDLPAALACLDPDLEWITQPSEIEGTYHGHEGFKKFVADTRGAFETFELHLDLRDLGEQVLAWGTIRARGSASGVEMEFPVAGTFEFRDRSVVRWQDFGSKEKALEAVGLRE